MREKNIKNMAEQDDAADGEVSRMINDKAPRPMALSGKGKSNASTADLGRSATV